MYGWSRNQQLLNTTTLMNTSQLGNIGEARVLSELVKLNIQCFTPFGDGSTVDLIAMFHGKLNRIQVKTTAQLNSVGAMEWKLTRQDGFHGSRAQYSIEDIDYLALYCLETDTVCMIPFTEDLPKSTLSIRLDSYTGSRLKTMRFAKDYTISSIIDRM